MNQKPILIDTHSHLNFPDYDKDRSEVVKESLANNVWLINVGCDKKTSEEVARLAQEYGEGVFASVGLHPHNIEEGFNSEEYRALINQNSKVVAIGEAGLDYRNKRQVTSDKDKELQKEIFKKQIELALELNKPLIIHCSKAHNETLDILVSYSMSHVSRLRGVAHSFLGNYKQARRYREMGFKLGFNGIITYARDYDKVILDTPLEDILIETDCPYLAPAPHRGQRNEPLYVIEVAKKLAEIKQISYERLVEKTTKNAREIFRL